MHGNSPVGEKVEIKRRKIKGGRTYGSEWVNPAILKTNPVKG
jgi:hypothetical protein